MKTAIVIPSYRVSRHIEAVLAGIPAHIDHILVVDDCCPEGSGDVAARSADPRVEVIRHAVNRGVGGAVLSGYARALELGCDIAVKMDGDGQMDPDELPRLIEPLVSGRVDYAKGNRFRHLRELKSMPTIRLLGNSALSFLVKAASGQWGVMDPTNGYTTLYLVVGVPLLAFGIGMGTVQWMESLITGVARTAGTVMLAAMPTILGFQLLLQAIAHDVQAAPKPRG
ncbi:MAG: glycosyltransferase family 2 protein [Magnetospirillum sp.]|nr:glycosyltransferase family 2 protein [Magnetospirillum sp.]